MSFVVLTNNTIYSFSGNAVFVPIQMWRCVLSRFITPSRLDLPSSLRSRTVADIVVWCPTSLHVVSLRFSIMSRHTCLVQLSVSCESSVRTRVVESVTARSEINSRCRITELGALHHYRSPQFQHSATY